MRPAGHPADLPQPGADKADLRSRHLVDPELLAGALAFPSLDLSPSGLAAARAQMEQVRQSLAAGVRAHPNILRRVEHAPAASANVRLLVYRPRLTPDLRPMILSIHGGGLVMGSADMDDRENSRWAEDLDCIIVSPDYRLAPETPYPGALEDCYAALLWMHANAAKLGGDARRIAIMGKSAGGGLAAALALLARDRGYVPIIHQHLIYPMLDDRLPRDPQRMLGEYVFNRENHVQCWRAYLGGAAPGNAGYAVPGRREDLAGLPPTFIGIGDLDLFVEAAQDYAVRLKACGVPAELIFYPGAYHGFDMVADAHVTRHLASARREALRRALRRPMDHGGHDAA
jgi:acetyl esterase/lipase